MITDPVPPPNSYRRTGTAVSDITVSTVRDDPFSHLVPKDEAAPSHAYSPSQQLFYRATSAICSFIFLFVLFLFASIHSLYVKLHNMMLSRVEFVTPEASGVPLRKLSNDELKLVPDLNYYFQLYGLQLDSYEVITQDGFVLSIQRIVDPKESTEQRSLRKPVLCLHGLLQSSASFCSSGKDSLAYFMFQNGFDVWLGNNRCGFEPRHTFLSPSDYRMWDWDILEMAQFDLPAMITHVLSNCSPEYTKLILIAHSQGTTQGFICLDNDRFGIASKIDSFIALAPAVYGGSLLDTKLFIQVISKMSMVHFFFGVHSFLPIMMTVRKYLLRTTSFSFFSYMMFNFLFDWNDTLWNHQLKGRHFLSSPVYISVRLMSWWLNDKSGFKQSKSILEHKKQWFNEHTPSILLVIPQRDKLVDGKQLVDHMNQHEPTANWNHIVLERYSHLDVLWANTVQHDIGQVILEHVGA